MKKDMKKFSFMASLLLGMLFLTACESNRDDNPVINLAQQQQPIQLNTPAFASGTYDLANTEFLELATTAPNYGFPATVTYVVQLSLDENMAEPNELTTTFTTNKMEVPGKEIAIAATKQLMVKKGKKQEEFPIETPVYLRLRAFISGVQGSETFSNTIKLNNIRTTFALPDVEVPDPFYVLGTYCENNWEKAMPTTPAYGNPSTQWRMVWIDKEGLVFSPIKGEPNYAEDMITLKVTSSTAGFTVKPDNSIVASTPGWYLMIIDGTIDNDKRELSLTVRFDEPNVWLIGTSIINPEAGIVKDSDPDHPEYVTCWTEDALRNQKEQYVKFTAPTDMKGLFVSPALTSPVDGDGGTRAYVKVKTMDWWKSEFFVFDKKIVYRGTGGDQERVNGNVGDRVYLNFLDDTGELKADE